MKQSLPFHHPYRHDFVRVAVAVPRIKVADPAFNAEQTIVDARAVRRRRRRAGRPAGAGPVGLHLRRPVPPAGAARRLRRGARPGGRGDRPDPGRPRSSACRCGSTTCCSTAPPSLAAAGCSASCPRPTCRTTASSTRRASSAAPTTRWRREVTTRRRSTCRSAADLIFDRRRPAAAAAARRDLRGPVGADPALDAARRWPAPPCSSTCRPRTSRSARPTTATSWSASSRRAAWRPTSTPRPASANRPPTWPGTARR